MLDEDDRVVVADGGFEQPFGVGGSGGHDDLQSGHMSDPGLEALGMIRAHSAADAALDSDGQWDFELSAGHVMELCGVIDELIHR